MPESDSRIIEVISAKEKARRKNRKIFPVVLLFCVLFCALGAGLMYWLYAPRRYSDADVDRYVKDIYGDSWRLRNKNTTSDREGGTARYLYARENGESFSVFTFCTPVLRDGIPAGRYRKALLDNYFSTVIDDRREKLEELAEKTHREKGIDLEIEETGEETGAFGRHYIFRLYLQESTDIPEAAELLESLDSLFAFSCRAGSDPFAAQLHMPVPYVCVYLKPDKARSKSSAADAVSAAAGPGTSGDSEDDASGGSASNGKQDEHLSSSNGSSEMADAWKETGVRDSYEISRILFTDLASPSRIRADQAAVRLENDYVDAARTFGRSSYYISEALWNKYPAPVLTLTNIGGNEPDGFAYRFIYHRETGTYWMTGLDLCEDFDGNPFGDYPRRGAFASLVRCLGGSFTADRKGAGWRIGESEWTATVDTKKTVKSPYTYERMHLTRDGSVMELDTVPELFRGTGATASARPFSIRDLITMLNVRITINQRDMSAVMFRDIEQEQ